MRPRPLTQEGLLGLFSPEETGAGSTLEPASQADMRGGAAIERRSLEVVYDSI
jgi:chlorophyllide a reductase subunit X